MAKKKSSKPSKPERWVNPGNPFGLGTPGGPKPLPPNADQVMALGGATPIKGLGPIPPNLKVVQTPEGPRLVPSNQNPLIADNIGGLIGSVRPKFSFNSQDEQYVNDLAARRRAFDTMLANITASEDTLGSNYGFGFQRYDTDQYNPQGVLVARAGDVNQTTLSTPTNYDQQTGLDTANPFSRASLLNQSYVKANRVGEGSYANRGLLTSGAYGRSLNRNAQDRAQSFDTLQKDFASRLNEYRNQRQGGYSQYDTDRTNLYRDAFARQRDTFLANNPS